MSAWQPIATAPKDGTNILAWCPHYWSTPEPMVIYFYIEQSRDGFRPRGWYYGKDELEGREQPTHWMPLPEPPK